MKKNNKSSNLQELDNKKVRFAEGSDSELDFDLSKEDSDASSEDLGWDLEKGFSSMSIENNTREFDKNAEKMFGSQINGHGNIASSSQKRKNDELEIKNHEEGSPKSPNSSMSNVFENAKRVKLENLGKSK